MRLGIIGSRSLARNRDVKIKVREVLEDYVDEKPTVVVGGAEGVDTVTIRTSKSLGYDCVVFKPYFKLSGLEAKAADFFIRNKQIVDNCDTLVAFWDGKSAGTGSSIKYARKKGKEVFVIGYEGEY